jgi:hypothetical protein
MSVDRDEDGLAAQGGCRPQGHRGSDAIDPRLVRGGRDDAAVVSTADTDHHRPASELRSITLFDGSEECVEVDVKLGGAYHRTMMSWQESPARV